MRKVHLIPEGRVIDVPDAKIEKGRPVDFPMPTGFQEWFDQGLKERKDRTVVYRPRKYHRPRAGTVKGWVRQGVEDSVAFKTLVDLWDIKAIGVYGTGKEWTAKRNQKTYLYRRTDYPVCEECRGTGKTLLSFDFSSYYYHRCRECFGWGIDYDGDITNARDLTETLE